MQLRRAAPSTVANGRQDTQLGLPSFGLKVFGYTTISASKDLILRSSYVSNLTSDLTSGKKGQV